MYIHAQNMTINLPDPAAAGLYTAACFTTHSHSVHGIPTDASQKWVLIPQSCHLADPLPVHVHLLE